MKKKKGIHKTAINQTEKQFQLILFMYSVIQPIRQMQISIEVRVSEPFQIGCRQNENFYVFDRKMLF